MTILPLIALLLSLSPPAPAPITVVELFTSQGCSSCPPADGILSSLAQDPQILALSFHVDYWDDLGWVDPHSDAAWSNRQRNYARQFREPRVYTPQLVIAGREHVVGSRPRSVRTRVAAQRRRSRSLDVGVTAARNRGRVTVTVGARPSGRYEVVLYTPASDNSVPRGENSGRHLEHTNVVRVVAPLGADASEVEFPAPPDATHGALLWRVDGAIVGAQRFRVR